MKLAVLITLVALSACAPLERRGPIVLEIDQESLGEDLSRAAVDAADDWCGAAGLALFAPYKGDGAPHVTITLGDLPDAQIGFSAGEYSADEPEMRGTVWASPKLHAAPASYGRGVLVHELGHLLELDHTERARDVMQDKIPRDWELTTEDLDAVVSTPHVQELERVSGIGVAKHSAVRCSDAWPL